MLLALLLWLFAGLGGVSAVAAEMPAYVRLDPVTANINAPTAVALDQNQMVYVIESSNNRLSIYDAYGTYQKGLQGLGRPFAIAVDGTGRIYIANGKKGNVEIYGADLTLQAKLGGGDGEFLKPVAIGVSAAGDSYVADNEAHTIRVYRADGSLKSSFGGYGNGNGQFTYPTSIAINESAQEVVVTDLQVTVVNSQPVRGARVQVFDLAGGYKRSFSVYGQGEGKVAKPQGVAVDASGRIYVADVYQNVVQVFDGNGLFLGTIYDLEHPLRTPLGMALNSTNRLYVASLNTHRVEVYAVGPQAPLPPRVSLINATSELALDKAQYNATDSATITSRATNQGAAQLADLTLALSITDPASATIFTKDTAIPQLAAGATQEFSSQYAFSSAAAGIYTVTQRLKDANGAVLDTQDKTYEVLSSALSGFGLGGSLSASPKAVVVGEPVMLAFTVGNLGNAAYTGLPLSVRIVNAAAATVATPYAGAIDLGVGGNHAGSQSWTAAGQVGETLSAILSATVGATTLTLAQDDFALVAPPLNLDIQQSIENGHRVLVLVSCGEEESDAAGRHGQPASCMTQRTQVIDNALTALDLPHSIVSNEADFRLALRSGIYNTYWISGKQDKLHDDLAAEIREAVYGGDSLVVDGAQDQRNKTLDTIAGVSYRGKNGETGLSVDLASPYFAVQRLGSAGRSLKLALNGGAEEAAFSGSKARATGPAIIGHDYGTGRSVLFGFDLVTSLQAQPQWQPVLGTSLEALLPANPTSLTPGGTLSVKTRIANHAQAVDLNVASVLPAGGGYLGSNPDGVHDASLGRIDWNFSLAQAQEEHVFLLLQAPSVSGSFALGTTVGTRQNGVVTPYGSALSLPIVVATAAETGVEAVQALQVFTLPKREQKLRDTLVAKLQAALIRFNENTAAGYEAAIGALLDVAGQLDGLTGVDTGPVHGDVVRILKEAQWRWTQLQ